MRWFNTCVHQREFSDVIGKVEFCHEERIAAGCKPQSVDRKGEQKGDQKGKEGPQAGGKPQGDQKEKGSQKPKAEQPKKEEKPKKEKEPEKDPEDFSDPVKKGKNPLDELPQSTMILDQVKKLFYSEKPYCKTFFKQLWDMFDNEGYSIWSCTYNFNDENTVYFMSANLVGGFIQRLDALRKYGFATLCLAAKDEDTPPYEISGCFIVRGQAIPAELKETSDAEYYKWSRLFPNKPDDRKMVETLFTADKIPACAGGGELPVLERRYFKWETL